MGFFLTRAIPKAHKIFCENNLIDQAKKMGLPPARIKTIIVVLTRICHQIETIG